MWKWDYFGAGAAFGTNAPSVQTLVVNLRFPGQYFDAETGLNYNYFRDYDPTTGRYVESDPIGLRGGPSTYSYVGSNPLLFRDTHGLARWKVVDSLEIGAAIGAGGKVLFADLTSDCDALGERFRISVVAVGPSAGLRA
ncbi:RHS repeat-associated core domain-containing protein [Rudaea sp.]|uniref:RHS repeat-associated core domain-containing protein n=1 Tax=Rudaea sp. TaxID=2136325 RepID=UPI0039E6D406